MDCKVARQDPIYGSFLASLLELTLERYPLGTSRYLSLWKDKIPSCTSQDLTRWFIHKLFYSFQLLSHTNKSWEVDTKVNRIIRAPEVPCLTSLSHRIIAGLPSLPFCYTRRGFHKENYTRRLVTENARNSKILLDPSYFPIATTNHILYPVRCYPFSASKPSISSIIFPAYGTIKIKYWH